MGLAGLTRLALNKNIMENSPIKIEYHYHNHVDTAEIISQLHIVRMQNHKILSALKDNDEAEKLEKQMDSWLLRLGKSVDAIKVVSDQVK